MTYQDILSTEDCCLPKAAEVLFPSADSPRWCVVYEGTFIRCDTLEEVSRILLGLKNLS